MWTTTCAYIQAIQQISWLIKVSLCTSFFNNIWHFIVKNIYYVLSLYYHLWISYILIFTKAIIWKPYLSILFNIIKKWYSLATHSQNQRENRAYFIGFPQYFTLNFNFLTFIVWSRQRYPFGYLFLWHNSCFRYKLYFLLVFLFILRPLPVNLCTKVYICNSMESSGSSLSCLL